MKRLLTAATAAIVLSFAAPAFAQTLEWTTGQLGGGWYTFGAGITSIVAEKHPDMEIRVVPGAGLANATLVNQGKAQIGFGLDVFSHLAMQGNAPYTEPHENLLTLGGSFSDNYLHLMREKSQPYDFEQLFTEAEDVSIAVTNPGSSTEMLFVWIMDYYGTNYDQLRNERGWKFNFTDYSEMANQFKDGQIDLAFGSLGKPAAAFIDMTLSRDAKFLAVPEDIQEAMRDQYGFRTGALTAEDYPEAIEGEVQVPTLVLGTSIDFNADLSEEAVYRITKTICENEGQLPDIHQTLAVFECATAAEKAPVPLHPGAERYYREAGYLN